MKHAKRKKLLVEDFNKALKWSDVEVCVYLFKSTLMFLIISDLKLAILQNIIYISEDFHLFFL